MIDEPSRTHDRVSRRAVLAALGMAPLTAITRARDADAVTNRLSTQIEQTREALSPGHALTAFRPGGAFDQFVGQSAAQDQFSGTVLIAYRAKPVFARAYGMANQSSGVPNRVDTIFNLASVTKCFTGVAVMQLVQAGAIRLDATLGTYVDGFAPKLAAVRVHQLLTHTAGLTDYTASEDFLKGLSRWNSAEAFMDGVMEIIRRQTEPDAAPGSEFRYSNSGFFVLGAIVQEVSSQSYYDYVRERIFAPAGMVDSDFYTTPQVLADARIARPYWTQRSGGRIDFTSTIYNGFTGGPADGVYCSAADLLRFITALQTGALLKPAFVDLLTGAKLPLPSSALPVPPVQMLSVAYGFFASILNNQRIVGHPGNGPGKATSLDVYPDADWVSVILSNYDTTINPIVNLERQLIADPRTIPGGA